MQRRTYIKTIALGSLLPLADTGYGFLKMAGQIFEGPQPINFKSNWQDWPDMKWAGPEYWGNRLQDWMVSNGQLVCDITGYNRTLHLLTIQNGKSDTELEVSTTITKLTDDIDNYNKGCAGIVLGAKGKFDDFRSAAVFGRGLNIGLTPKGALQFGEKIYETGMKMMPNQFKLIFKNKAIGGKMMASLKILDPISEEVLFEKKGIPLKKVNLEGNFALLANFGENKKTDLEKPSVSFANWEVSSPSLYQNKENLFGPICFAQYTLHRTNLKLTAQLAPIEKIEGHTVYLQFKNDGQWSTYKKAIVEHAGRAINFSISDWKEREDTAYRILIEFPLKNGEFEKHEYLGTISKEPADKEELKTAVFSCNAHYGFPDSDIHENVSKLNPDVILFLGDQFYEGTGGFGAMQKGDYDKTCLDYLRKWYMFGWSYRELFRHKPCAIIPDDHDVYHGNVWGEEGKKADTSKGFGATAQDSGGYKMSAAWVNMVQFTQTSHLPDAFDPTPVKQGIGVYYTQWNYAGISFAILEDRKFKSAPKHVLPKEAQVNNGWIMNDNFDIKQHKNLGGELLGKRQEDFLEKWVADWSENTEFKVLLSQTNFATVATLPEGAKTGAVIPSLKIPEKGEYIQGDSPTVDMDSNGWPSIKRDRAVETIRKGFTFHIAGDQHLGSFIQYGLDAHGDSGHAFAGPALNNLWPRRFWPNKNSHGHTYENPTYTGEHEDGFGNKMTVMAVANPHQMHKKPEILHNRAVGYGIVTFNKENRQIVTECWPRFIDPLKESSAQYPGWPITIGQEENYAREAKAYLPELRIQGASKPVIKVYKENGELVYATRLKKFTFKPKVFEEGSYTILIEVPETGFQKKLQKLKAKKNQSKVIRFSVT